jgi:hypothetical protein
MNPVSIFPSRFLRMTALLITGLATVPAIGQSTTQRPPKVLSLGTVTVLGPTNCPGGATKGATCTSVNVSCPGIPDLTAIFSEVIPTGTAKGTIILLSGSGGTTFFNSGFGTPYLNDGFRVVQLAWTTDWEVANGVGLKSASCRGATFFKYVFDNIQGGDRTTGFCAQGTSGGGAAIAYSLVQYGLSNFFDYVVIAAGPGVARMDYGCDSSLYTGPPLDLCPLINSAPYVYSKGSGNKVNSWENTTSCVAKSPLSSDIKKWAADSIVTPGANFTYPKTAMSWYFCATPPVNNSTGEGKFLIDKVVPKNNPPDVSCYSGVCKGEAVWQDPNAFTATQSEMVAQCVPNHQ